MMKIMMNVACGCGCVRDTKRVMIKFMMSGG